MIRIRPATVQDADLILTWENDPRIWSITDQPGPFDRSDIIHFLTSANHLVRNGQARWIIEDNKASIGMLDLFEFNRENNSVGLGIIIMEEEKRSKGAGARALTLIENDLSLSHKIQLIWVLVHTSNDKAANFFIRNGYLRNVKLNHLGKEVEKFEKYLK